MTFERIEVNPTFAEMRARLKQAGDGWPKRIQKANKSVAKKVADKAADKYPRHYRRRSGAAQRSIRALASQSKAQVAIGRATVPYAVGQNFGSKRRYPQFAPKAEPDRFIYATVAEEMSAIEEMHGKEIDAVFDEAFPERTAL